MIHDFKFGLGGQDNIQNLYDHYYNSNCSIGVITRVDVVAQTVAVRVDGFDKFEAAIPLAQLASSGSRGSASPDVGDLVLLVKHQGGIFAALIVPHLGVQMTEAGVKKILNDPEKAKEYEKVPLAPHMFDMLDKEKYDTIKRDDVVKGYYVVKSKKEIAEDFKLYMKQPKLFEKKPEDPTSPLTGREITFPGDAVLYSGDEGNKIVGLRDGRLAIIGGPFCHSTWNKKDNLLDEVVMNRHFHFGGGFMVWSTDFKKLEAGTIAEYWMQPNNLDGRRIVAMTGTPAEKDRMAVTRLEKNTSIYRLSKRELIDKLKKKDFLKKDKDGKQIDPVSLMDPNAWTETSSLRADDIDNADPQDSSTGESFIGMVKGFERTATVQKENRDIPVWQFQVDKDGMPKLALFKKDDPNDKDDPKATVKLDPKVKAETNDKFVECLTIEFDKTGKIKITTRSEVDLKAKEKISIQAQKDVLLHTDKDVTVSSEKNVTLSAKESINIKAGKNVTVDSKEPVTVTLNKGGVINSKADLKLSSDKDIIMEPKGNFKLVTGGKLDMTSKSVMNFKGSKVNIDPPPIDEKALLNKAEAAAKKNDKATLDESKKSSTSVLQQALKNDASVLSSARSYTDTRISDHRH